MAEDKQSFAQRIMSSMFSKRGDPNPLQNNLTAITQNLNANFDRMLQGARAVTDPYITSALPHIDAAAPFDRNAANIIQSFQVLDNKIRIVDKNVQVNTVLLQYNKKLMEATNASLNRAISESRNADRRNVFQDTENKMEEGALNKAIDRRINDWIEAGYISGGSGGGAAAGVVGGLLGGTAGAAAAGLTRLASTVVTKIVPIGLVAGFPQAMDNPDQNMYTEIGRLLDWTKSLVDPSYHGTEARDLARSIVRKIKDYDTQLQKERMVKKALSWWQHRKAEREYDRKYGGFYDPDYEYTDAEKKQMSEAAGRRELEGAIARGNRTMGRGPTRRGRIRKDWKKEDGSDFGIERIPTPDEMKRLDIPDDLKVPGYQYPEKEPAPLLRLPTPDDLKVPGYQYPLERVPNPKKVSSIFGRRDRGERIQVASLGDGREFLPRNTEDAYAERLSRFVESGDSSLESVDQELDKFSLTSMTFGIRARIFDLYALNTFDLEAQNEITIRSKRSIVIEAPEVAIVGKLSTYSTAKDYDRATSGAGGASANPMSPNAPQNMPARSPAVIGSDPGSPFGLMNGGGGRAPAPSWAGGGGGYVGGGSLAATDLPPEAAALLNTIAAGEAGKHGYNAINYMAGGGAFEGFANHPFAGQKGYTAAGRYQILASNWEKYAPQAGVTDFSPASQDKVAWLFAQDVYHRTTGRDLHTDLKDPNFDKSFITSALKPTWHGIQGGSTLSKELTTAYNPAPTPTASNGSGGNVGTGEGGIAVPSQEFRGTNGGAAELKMTNKNATRNDPITDSLRSKLQESVYAVYGPGYSVEVYSGGQEAKGEGGSRTGSTRHDHGNAADVYVVGPDGKRVKGDRLGKLGQYWTAKGYGGVGLEMKGGGIHLDTHTDRAPSWNYGGGETPAARAAVEAGKKGILPDNLFVAPDQKAPVAGLRLPQTPVKPVDRVDTKAADELVKSSNSSPTVVVNKPTTVVAAPEKKPPPPNTHDNVNMSASGMLGTSSMIV